jgi:hypothetical protein
MGSSVGGIKITSISFIPTRRITMAKSKERNRQVNDGRSFTDRWRHNDADFKICHFTLPVYVLLGIEVKQLSSGAF